MSSSHFLKEQIVFGVLLFIFGSVFGYFSYEPITDFFDKRQQQAIEKQKLRFIGKNIKLLLKNHDWDVINGDKPGVLVQKKPRVLIFWSPSCDHCKKAMEVIKIVYEKYKQDNEVVFIGFLVSNDIELLKTYTSENHIEFPQIVSTEKNKIKKMFEIYSIPQLWTLKADHTVSNIITDFSLDSLESAISSCESCTL